MFNVVLKIKYIGVVKLFQCVKCVRCTSVFCPVLSNVSRGWAASDPISDATICGQCLVSDISLLKLTCHCRLGFNVGHNNRQSQINRLWLPVQNELGKISEDAASGVIKINGQ